LVDGQGDLPGPCCVSVAECLAGKLPADAAAPRGRHDAKIRKVPALPLGDCRQQEHAGRLPRLHGQPPALGIMHALRLVAFEDFIQRADAVDLRAIKRALVTAQQGLPKELSVARVVRLKLERSIFREPALRQVEVMPHVPKARDATETVTLQRTGELYFL